MAISTCVPSRSARTVLGGVDHAFKNRTYVDSRLAPVSVHVVDKPARSGTSATRCG
jgi:hypothetical protein